MKRFRATICVELFIHENEDIDDLEGCREKATKILNEIVEEMNCKSWVCGVAHYTPENLLKPLDREI